MSRPWVCASCRQLLRRRVPSTLQGRALSYSQSHQQSTKVSRWSLVEDEERSKSRPIPTPDLQYERSVEEDFVARLMRDTGHDLTSGPYSNPRPPRHKRRQAEIPIVNTEQTPQLEAIESVHVAARQHPQARQDDAQEEEEVEKEVEYVLPGVKNPMYSSFWPSASSSSSAVESPSPTPPSTSGSLHVAASESSERWATQKSPLSRVFSFSSRNTISLPSSSSKGADAEPISGPTSLNASKVKVEVKRDVDAADPLRASTSRASNGGSKSNVTSNSPASASTNIRKFVVDRKGSSKQQEPLHQQLEKRIGRAIEDQNVVRLEELWKAAQTAIESRPSNLTLPQAIQLYNLFLTGFMGLQRPSMAIMVWNSALEHGVNANISMWDAILKGCGVAKDFNALRATWDRMLSSGVKPDGRAWTTLINSMVKCGRMSQGLETFQRMAAEWVTAAKAAGHEKNIESLGDVGGTPKPTIQALNALVFGFSRQGIDEELAKLLRWGKSLGIKPDAFTLNPILESSYAADNPARAQKILRLMQENLIQPDIATFTIRLDALFRGQIHFDEESLTADLNEEQADAESDDAEVRARATTLADIFQDMKQAGIQANAHTFATIVSGLLNSSSPNVAAASALLKRMKANDIPLSSAVLTSLINYHFKSDPPNIAAIETLEDQARRQVYRTPDNAFYDRLIDGYAKLGLASKALTALNQASKNGKTPGWGAMRAIIQTLTAQGEWTRAEEILDEVRKQDKLTDNPRSRFGRGAFWRTVQDLGLGGSST